MPRGSRHMQIIRALVLTTMAVPLLAGTVAASTSSGIVRITSAPANDLAPAYSPDGAQLAFLSLRDSNAGGEIYVSNLSGSNQRRLTTNGDGAAGPKFSPLVWSPDGTKIAFVELDSDQEPGCCPPTQSEIYAVDVATGVTTNLTNTLTTPNQFPFPPTPVNEFGPAWSPDGSRILFGRVDADGSHLYTMAADGANIVQLTSGPANDGEATWSADGTRILFERDGNISDMNADGTAIRQLTTGQFNDRPLWSPDGSQISFRTSVGANGYEDIFVMSADGSHVIDVSHSSKYLDDEEVWSPDGKKLAFVAQDGSGTFSDIFVVDQDGTGAKDVSKFHTSVSSGPAWSPDGRSLAIFGDRNQPGNLDIYTITP
jgi:Tol biopolymer transport system component